MALGRSGDERERSLQAVWSEAGPENPGVFTREEGPRVAWGSMTARVEEIYGASRVEPHQPSLKVNHLNVNS